MDKSIEIRSDRREGVSEQCFLGSTGSAHASQCSHTELNVHREPISVLGSSFTGGVHWPSLDEGLCGGVGFGVNMPFLIRRKSPAGQFPIKSVLAKLALARSGVV